jgi:hypothetical protein
VVQERQDSFRGTCTTFFARYKKGKVEESDADFVLNHMRQMEENDPEFFSHIVRMKKADW